MAGSIIISDENVWTVGSHAFTPLMERLKESFCADAAMLEEAKEVFAPLDEGFEFISLKNLSSIAFRQFAAACKLERHAIQIDSMLSNTTLQTLDLCLSGLLSQLEADSRSLVTESERPLPLERQGGSGA